MHVDRSFKIGCTLCVHNPKNSGFYGLFFCDLSNYKHKSYVHIQLSPKQQLYTSYVILPVFLDPYTGEYAPPKDIINSPNHGNHHHQHQNHNRYQQQRNHRLIEEEQQKRIDINRKTEKA
jgi:hypothetical protein